VSFNIKKAYQFWNKFDCVEEVRPYTLSIKYLPSAISVFNVHSLKYGLLVCKYIS